MKVIDKNALLLQLACLEAIGYKDFCDRVRIMIDGAETEVAPALNLVGGSAVIADVVAERQRQDAKWGEQNHDMADYYTILGEEFGEVGKAICESKLQKIVHRHEIRKELVQLAAVAVAMAEAFDRQESRLRTGEKQEAKK